MKRPSETIKKLFSISIISILLVSLLTPVSFVYADIVSSDQYDTSSENVDLFEQQAEQERLEAVFGDQGFSDDPTMLSRGSNDGVDVAGTVGSCLSGLLSNIVGGMVTDMIGDFASNLTGSLTGGLLGGSKVPVADSEVIDNTGKQVAKEVDSGMGISMDGIAHCVGNMVVEGILTSTTNWIRGGFNGSPSFVDNPEKFFTDIADYELGQALNDLSNGVLCSPYDIDIRLGLLNRYRTTSTYRRSCTLTDIIGYSDDFIDGHFQDGGWDAWFELTQNPHNNPFTTYLTEIGEYETRVSSRRNATTIELNWGDGFRSEKDSRTGDTTTPGNLVQTQVSKTLNIPSERLTFADEFDEVIDALFDTMLSTMFEGLGM